MRKLATGFRPYGGARITYANDGLGADELDELVDYAALSIALGIGVDVSKVTNVADLISGSTVGFTMGVDYRRKSVR